MKTILIHSLFITLLFTFTACGENGETEAPGENDARTVEIIGVDEMKFVVQEAGEGLVTGEEIREYLLLEAIEASPGEELTIRLSTMSNMPAIAMSHNWALLVPGTDADAFINASIAARDNDFIAPEYEDQVIARTAMLGDGESDTITFTVPEESGEYDYVCSFPGHFQGGMRGKLIVR